MINTKQELMLMLNNNIDVIKGYGINKFGVFGSFRHDKATAKSDVDFLVNFIPEKKTYDNFFYLHEFLEEKTGRKIELVTIQSLSKYIGPRILKDVEYVIH